MNYKIIKVFFTSFLMIFASSCATTQQIEQPIFTASIKVSEYKLEKGLKVGVISILNPNITHFHIGTTIFNNFQRQYDVDWGIPNYINVKIKNDLESMGYQYKKIKINEEWSDIIQETVSRDILFGKYYLNPGHVADIQKFAGQQDIDVLVIVKTYKDVLGGAINRVSGYGFYTSSFMGMNINAYAFAHISASVIYMEAPSLIAHHFINEQPAIEQFTFRGNIKNVSDDEINKAEPYLKRLVDNLIDVLSMDFRL